MTEIIIEKRNFEGKDINVGLKNNYTHSRSYLK